MVIAVIFVVALTVLALDICALVAVKVTGTVYLGRTRGGRTIVRDDRHLLGDRIRVLDVAGTYQSATYLDDRWCDPVFPYHQLFDHLFDGWPDGTHPHSIAVLGGGGYAYPKHLVAHHPEVDRIDVVEIDPDIQRIAYNYFFLDKLEQVYGAQAAGRLVLHVDDAFRWLQSQDQRFDAIVNDCFLGLSPDSALMGAEAAACFAAHLTTDGVYLTNVVSALEGPDSRTLYEAIHALATSFRHIWVYPLGEDEPASRENNIIIASNANRNYPDAWIWPEEDEGH